MSQSSNRPIARLLAKELTTDEIDTVGGASGSSTSKSQVNRFENGMSVVVWDYDDPWYP